METPSREVATIREEANQIFDEATRRFCDKKLGGRNPQNMRREDYAKIVSSAHSKAKVKKLEWQVDALEKLYSRSSGEHCRCRCCHDRIVIPRSYRGDREIAANAANECMDSYEDCRNNAGVVVNVLWECGCWGDASDDDGYGFNKDQLLRKVLQGADIQSYMRGSISTSASMA